MPAELVDLDKEFHLGNGFTLETAGRLCAILGDEYRVIVKYDRKQDLPVYPDNKRNVVIATGRETHDIPNEFFREDVFAIFQHYFMLDPWGDPIHNPLAYPMPLGPFRESNNNIIKPLSERKYDFSFIGQIPNTGSRDSFKRNLDKLIEESGSKFNFFVKYTDGFSKGLDPEEYLNILSESKISLCPQGGHSFETFRFFESIQSGAIPFVEQLPRLWYYEVAPHIKTPWRDLDSTLSKMLNFLQTPNCRKILYQVADYCKTVLMPTNLANHLAQKVEFKEQNTDTFKESLKEIRKNLHELVADKL